MTGETETDTDPPTLSVYFEPSSIGFMDSNFVRSRNQRSWRSRSRRLEGSDGTGTV
jgi:hypothetical protein